MKTVIKPALKTLDETTTLVKKERSRIILDFIKFLGWVSIHVPSDVALPFAARLESGVFKCTVNDHDVTIHITTKASVLSSCDEDAILYIVRAGFVARLLQEIKSMKKDRDSVLKGLRRVKIPAVH